MSFKIDNLFRDLSILIKMSVYVFQYRKKIQCLSERFGIFLNILLTVFEIIANNETGIVIRLSCYLLFTDFRN